MPKIKSLLILGLIVALAFSLRVYRVAMLPDGLTWDETAIGYNAYSILKTGRDEHGAFMPLVFKSFGDYKPGIYIYTVIPFVQLFGLGEYAVRMPSVIAGTILSILIYFLVLELDEKNEKWALFSAFIISVSPWSIFYSRGAWEVNLYCTFLVTALWLYLRFLKGKNGLYWSALLALISIYTYQAGKMLTPLLLVTLTYLYRKKFYLRLKNRTSVFVVALFICLAVLIGWQNIYQKEGNRLARLSILGYKPELSQDLIKTDGSKNIAQIFHSQIELSARLIASRFLYHFSPEMLFYEGPVVTVRGHIPRSGVLLITDLVLITIALARSEIKRKHMIFIFAMLLISALPASLTLSEFSTTRALFMVVPFAVLSGLGASLLKRNIFSLLLLGLYGLNCFYIVDLYFNHSSDVIASEFNWGQRQAVNFTNKYPNSRVIMTDVYGQPYIYQLFYSAYPPEKYQKLNNFHDGGVDVGFVPSFDRYEFRQFSLHDVETYKNTVFIGTIGNLPDSFVNSNPHIEYREDYKLKGDLVLRAVKTYE